jgi:hypothetical protein
VIVADVKNEEVSEEAEAVVVGTNNLMDMVVIDGRTVLWLHLN